MPERLHSAAVDEEHVEPLGRTPKSPGHEPVGHFDSVEGSNTPVYANSDGQSVTKAHDGDDQEWAKLFGLSMSATVDDSVLTSVDCENMGVPKASDRPMGWAVFRGSKMRDVVHLSCHACLTDAEKKLHAANIKVFLQMQRATLFSGSEGQELVVKDV